MNQTANQASNKQQHPIENVAEAEALSDLSLTGEQAGETKAGADNASRIGDRFTTTVVDSESYR